MFTYKKGRGWVESGDWKLFFDDPSNSEVTERILRLTGWNEKSLPDHMVSIWKILCGRLHDKRSADDYQRDTDKITISGQLLTQEQCLACAALLHFKYYPVEIVPQLTAWEEEVNNYY